jgi:hypothetical protein
MAATGRLAPAIGPGAPLTWPGAFAQFPLPLQASADGPGVPEKTIKAAAATTPDAIFIDLVLGKTTGIGCYVLIMRPIPSLYHGDARRYLRSRAKDLISAANL